MRIAYFDCFSGAAGDMILGALLDAGLAEADLRDELAKVELRDYTLDAGKVRKQGFAATKVEVRPTAGQGHRHLRDILRILDASRLDAEVRRQAAAVFTRLAEAEAAAHGIAVEKVHFHEVGAVDAIVDVVGAVAGLHRLGVRRVECSPIPVGSGVVQCEHGTMPVPAPATAALLRGVPIAASDEPGELTTPTGAAILTTLAAAYGPMPPMTIESIGCGAGSREGRTRPNFLRVLIGQSADRADAESEEIVILETHVDDLSGEAIGYAIERLLAAGARDVFAAPIVMKKNRPGHLLTVLADRATADALEALLFAETTTFGVRRRVSSRRVLERTSEPVETRFGRIRIKVGRRAGRIVVASPEYEDCAAAARSHDVSLREIMDEARHVWRSGVAGRAE